MFLCKCGQKYPCENKKNTLLANAHTHTDVYVCVLYALVCSDRIVMPVATNIILVLYIFTAAYLFSICRGRFFFTDFSSSVLT